MKKRMLFGCLLSIFVLTTFSSVQAAETSITLETVKSNIIKSLEKIEVKSEKLEEMKSKSIDAINGINSIDDKCLEKLQKIDELLGKVEFKSIDNTLYSGYLLIISMLCLIRAMNAMQEGNYELALLYLGLCNVCIAAAVYAYVSGMIGPSPE